MSVDVSPDGKTIVFDLLGDIYAVPIAGGTATAITSGPAYDSHPRFSPDGKTIAFTSDRSGIENVWLMDADGKNPRALTTEKDAYVRSAAWTPDGNYLIARKEDGKRGGIPPVELWIYHREGGGGIKLTSSDDVSNAGGAVASKDGKSIYYAARARKFNYIPNLQDGLWQIFRYDRALAESFPVTSGFGGAVRPALSPDGKTLVFISRRDDDTVMVARDLASGSERILARGVTRDEEEGFAQMDLWPNYAFTPDGKSLVFSNAGKLSRMDVASGAITEIPFTAAVEQFVAPRVTWQEKVESGPVKARILRWPSQSPDGTTIAFEAFGRVWLQEIAGGKTVGSPRRLTKDDATLPHREYAPAFSPDGKSIAYVSWSDAEGGQVWKAAAVPGAAPVKLTRHPGHYANPAWSPKGDQHRDPARLGPRVPRPPARGGGLLRARRARRGRRRDPVRSRPSSSATGCTSTRRPSGTRTERGSTTATRSRRRSRPTIRRTTSSRSASTAPTRRRTCASPPWTTSSPRPTGSGSSSPRATTST